MRRVRLRLFMAGAVGYLRSENSLVFVSNRPRTALPYPSASSLESHSPRKHGKHGRTHLQELPCLPCFRGEFSLVISGPQAHRHSGQALGLSPVRVITVTAEFVPRDSNNSGVNEKFAYGSPVSPEAPTRPKRSGASATPPHAGFFYLWAKSSGPHCHLFWMNGAEGRRTDSIFVGLCKRAGTRPYLRKTHRFEEDHL